VTCDHSTSKRTLSFCSPSARPPRPTGNNRSRARCASYGTGASVPRPPTLGGSDLWPLTW
jgi:hypothetical protein